MKKGLRFAGFIIFLAAPAYGQTKYYYCPDSNPSQGSCNVIPFGTGSSSWADQRAQFLVKKSFLPSKPGLLRSIGFAPRYSGSLKYKAIVIKIGHNTTGALSRTFENNFSTYPITVFNKADLTWTVTAKKWNRIPLERPFVYNGKDNLVIDVTALGSDLNTKPCFYRGSEPRCFNTRILQNSSFSNYGKGCNGSNKKEPLIKCLSLPLIGSTMFDIGLEDAVSNAPAVILIGDSNTNYSGLPLPFDLGFLGATGCKLYTSILMTEVLGTNRNGSAAMKAAVPNAGSLVGLNLFSQWVIVDPGANSAGFVTTGGLQLKLGKVVNPNGTTDFAALKVEIGIM